MSRRKKLTAKYTPLSLIDKIIYFILAVSIFAVVIFGFIGLGIYIPKTYAKNQGEVIAVYNSLATILAIPVTTYLSGILLFCWISLYNKKQPFFGNKNYKSKGPTIKTYPLFSSEFKHRPKKYRKRQIFITLIICVGVLVAMSLLYLLGLANREVITNDYTVEKYNSFNQIKDERKIEEAEEVLIYVKKHTHRGRLRYNLIMEFSYGDDYYDFGLGSFFGNDEKILNDMISIKENIPKEKIQVDTKYYQELMNYQNYNEKETELIYELFSK